MKIQTKQRGEVNVNTNPNWMTFLGVIFILCKIFSVPPIVDWSWWLVLLPFYFGIALAVGFIVIGFTFAAVLYGAALAIEGINKFVKRLIKGK
jgi:hypothetical protein